MPQKRAPDSLLDASLLCIERNFEQIINMTRGEFHRLDETNAHFPFNMLNSPFSLLPSSLLDDLLLSIRERGSISKLHLHHLMLRNLTEMDITPDIKHAHLALKLLVERCKNLRRLSLSYLQIISPYEMGQLFRHLGCLTSLDLQMAFCSDHTLLAISRCCPLIEELNLHRTMVSDAGLEFLGGSADCDGIENYCGCRNLQVLRITETQCTAIGVAGLLISLPGIYELDFDNMMQVFELISESTGMSDCLMLKLQCVKSSGETVSFKAIDALSTINPLTQKVVFTDCEIDSPSLWRLAGLKHLSELHITNTETMAVLFDEGVLPLLQMCGKRLHSLILNRFTSVCLSAIDRECPCLSQLALSQIQYYQPWEPSAAAGFSSLQALELWTAENLDTDQLKLLLTSCSRIQNLLIQRCSALTDNLLHSIWQINPMRCLRRLTLDSCDGISCDPLVQLTSTTNQLQVLRLWSCRQLTASWSRQLQGQLTKENADLRVEFW